MRIKYVNKRFGKKAMDIIAAADDIVQEYQDQGFDLTLRQLYYQFVSRNLIANKQSEYKRLGSIINDARMAGLLDWTAIVDRTRNARSNTHWSSPQDILRAASRSFYRDRWTGQVHRFQVWIEKDALIGVIEGVCQDLDVPYFSCRGYVSQSEMWQAGRLIKKAYEQEGHATTVLHMGDHDPSGIDMTRDIQERLSIFAGFDVAVERIALNKEQIKEFDPPPNPAKITDSRFTGYMRTFGKQSWELDALSPIVLTNLIRVSIEPFIDVNKWQQIVATEAIEKEKIERLAQKWGRLK